MFRMRFTPKDFVLSQKTESTKYVYSSEVTFAQQAFIEHWQEIGKHWGVPKALLAVHAWLILRSEPQSTDDVMLHLGMSRGNAHNTLLELVEWGLAHSIKTLGKRQIRFVAEKEEWAMMTAIIRMRKKRELDPFLTLEDWRQVHASELASGACDGLDQRLQSWMVTAQKLDRLTHLASREDESWWRRWLFSALRTN
jgi:DNA-binding transcriptional regulator GbsR (MarR family)